MLRGRVRIQRTINEVEGRLIGGEPKTNAGRRTLTTPPFLVELLAAQIAATRDPEGWVFPAINGGPMRRNAFSSTGLAAGGQRGGHGKVEIPRSQTYQR